MRKLLLPTVMLIASTVVSCGGGGGGETAAEKQPVKAVVKLETSGTLATGSFIGGIDVTLNLPATASVNASADSANVNVFVTDPDVVAASGVSTGANATVMGTYTASPKAVSVKILNPAGFGTGEFVTVNCNLAAGATVAASDFSTGTLSVFDLNGANITGLTAGMTVYLQ